MAEYVAEYLFAVFRLLSTKREVTGLRSSLLALRREVDYPKPILGITIIQLGALELHVLEVLPAI